MSMSVPMKRSYASPRLQSRPREKCLVDGCDRLEELASGRSAGGLCAAHRKRKKRGQPLEPPIDERNARVGPHRAPLRSPRQALLDAALAYADADAENADGRLFTLLRRARIYGRARQGR